MLYLASKSPRRATLLQQIGVPFTTVSTRVDETIFSHEAAASYVRRMARAKAGDGISRLDSRSLVLGADTVVVLAGEVMGKPANEKQARDMLGRLSGREHQVLSAVALMQGDRCSVSLSTSRVRFRALTEQDMDVYLSLGEYRDKAGAYAIQGAAAVFVEQLTGSYSGVMGLPLYELADLLHRFEVVFPFNSARSASQNE